MEMRASQVIKGALGGEAKKKMGGENREERRETPSHPKILERWRMSGLFSSGGETSVEHRRFDPFGSKGQTVLAAVLQVSIHTPS